MSLKVKVSVEELGCALDTMVPRLLAEKNVEGVSIALIRDRQAVLESGFGMRNASTGDPITPQSVFEAYSLTKPLVAYRALSLCEQGALDLDRPLNYYMSELCTHTDGGIDRVTVRMVLSHTSGLPDDETDRSIAFAPGEAWSYSTLGFYYLQQVIDYVSGQDFEEEMRECVLSPLSMKSSSFVWEDRFRSVMAQGHNAQGVPESDRQIRVADADSLLTTASDYARFVIECMRPGQANRRVPLQMTQRQVAVSDRLHWGLGWGIEETDDGPIFWHIGGGRGAPFQNFVLASSFHGIGIVILTNSTNGESIFDPIVRLTIGGDYSLFEFVRAYFF